MTATSIRPTGTGASRFSATRQLVTFMLGKEEYAVGVSHVREIIRLCPTTSIPHSPPFVKGLVNLRNLVVPVIDLRLRLDLEAAPLSKRSRIVVVQIEDRTIGMIVDGVTGVIRFAEEDVLPLPPATAEADAKYLRGILQKDDAFLILLDVESLFETRDLVGGGQAG